MLRLRARVAFWLIAATTLTACGGDVLFGGSPSGPAVDCTGVPAEQCRNAIAEALSNPAHRARVVAITIRCTAPLCTPDEGDMTVTVRLADGSQTTSMSAWALAPAPAPGATIEVLLPVKPTCAGVPVKACEQFATDAVQQLDRPTHTVVSILVRCAAAAPCLDGRGAGSTDVTFRDGTHQTMDWLYEGAIDP